MFGSHLRWPRRRSRPIAARVWNSLNIETRQEILVREGFSGEDVHRLCAKRWKELSEAERVWLATPVSLEDMTRVIAPKQDRSNPPPAFHFRNLLNLFGNRTR